MSNKKKQNSIDWLVEELRKYIEEPWKYVPKGGKEAIVEQAKEMHRQEIINAVDGFPLENRNLNGTEYYEQTYGGNNE
jgi:cytochrome c2